MAKKAPSESTAPTDGSNAGKDRAGKENTPKAKPHDGKLIEAAYAPLAKRHDLPPFAPLCMEFDLDAIDPEQRRLLKEVAKKMFERTDLFRKVLEGTQQPDMSIASMQEAERLGPAEHERIADLVRTLMRLDRQLLAAELENTDDAYAAFIRDAAVTRAMVKRDLTPLIASMMRGWSTPAQKQSSHNQYLG